MRTLLLADDSVTTQRVVALTFADESFRVVTVPDGQQALDAMAAMRPDIVLASTALPGMNGYELSTRMQGIEALGQVPLLLLAGAFESVDAAQLKTSGARGVIEKPLEPTVVISRVRELLGLKDARPAAPAGRLVTSAGTTTDKKADKKAPSRPAVAPPAPKPAVTTWDELRQETGLEPDARSVEGGTQGSGREDYLDTLDAAFDSLDKHLSGRNQDAQVPQRNPSGPLGQAAGAADPRSPGRLPSLTAEGQPPNAVFEVDSDWFSNDDRDRDRASSHEITADAQEAMPAPIAADPPAPVFEVDDEWFAADEQARGERLKQHRELAAEMGIHDVELPAVEPGLTPAPAEGLDFDFGLDDLMGNAPAASAEQKVQGVREVQEVREVEPVPPVIPTVTAEVSPAVLDEPTPAASVPMPASLVSPVAPPMAALAPVSVADDFAALLAFETGDGPAPAPAAAVEEPVPAAPVVIQASAPEITEAMLDQIADRVVERLTTASFGAGLREAMTTTLRDTVRTVVSEASERLVRDEIARIKGRVERDTQ
jgi:CheY-like chemotaxis protein